MEVEDHRISAKLLDLLGHWKLMVEQKPELPLQLFTVLICFSIRIPGLTLLNFNSSLKFGIRDNDLLVLLLIPDLALLEPRHQLFNLYFL